MRVLNLTAASPRLSVKTRLRSSRARARLLNRHVEGQALVEFALTLPLLLIMVTAIFWFGTTFNHYLELTTAVGIGGELFSVSRGSSYTDPCAQAVTTIQTAAPLLSWTTATPAPTYSFVLTPSGGSGTSYGGSCSGVALATNEQAAITVTYPCALPFSIFSMGPLFTIQTPSCTLTAQVTELIQ
jgi:Flp pilus assembly protein TadG